MSQREFSLTQLLGIAFKSGSSHAWRSGLKVHLKSSGIDDRKPYLTGFEQGMPGRKAITITTELKVLHLNREPAVISNLTYYLDFRSITTRYPVFVLPFPMAKKAQTFVYIEF